ncbi:AAA family ATPase [Fusibacter paucivorans]|uniref:AAA family ATPase n=1 Tax=Fusibacter paucivorans TaxID=76009 RepID=A0ABS5PPM5_9FIRM|nr:AAA family ATPase [Fusibacter paucivorans]MBS7527124.1 AAA family ATPase [Fusibacter paucivorans]
MKLQKIIISNYRCFGKTPTTILIDDLTGLIGHNSSGKTALITSLIKMFGDKATDRNIERADFHIPVSQNPESINENEMFIEAYFTFDNSLMKEDALDVPVFFKHFVIDAPQGKPFLRVRLDAMWKKSTNPDGVVESKISYITTGSSEFEESDCHKANRQELERIKIVYIPAIRQPNEQLKNVSGSIMYRLLNSIKWSDKSKTKIIERTELVEQAFLEEESILLLADSLDTQWNEYHKDQRYSNAKIKFNSSDLETILKKVEVTFSPTQTARSFKTEELGDGLRSLFYLSIVDTMLDIEEKIMEEIVSKGASKHFDLLPPILTIVAVEEPENHISPQILGRVIERLKTISAKANSQSVVTSHSPSIIKRIDPTNIRYFRTCKINECSEIRALTLPNEEKEASQFKYIKEAVTAYPELYFAKLVVLGEGDSEEIILKKMLELKNTRIDTTEISVVPLGGRHVNHFWRLLSDLNIPFITLLDLDKERDGGGWGRIKYSIQQLIENGKNRDKLLDTTDGVLSEDEFNDMHTWTSYEDIDGWIEMLEKYDVYFSTPLDIDFAMLTKFKEKYVATLASSEGPYIKGYGKIHKPDIEDGDSKEYEDLLEKRIQSDLRATLKNEGGDGATYSEVEKELMIWYNYFFLNRGKPTTHRVLFTENEDIIFEDFPDCLQKFVNEIITKSN